jgi:hypothetical protein
MANETSSFNKAAVLTGLTVLMGGAEVSGAEASQLLPLPSSVSQTVGPGSANAVNTELDFNQFNGPGTLTGVEFNLTSTIEQITNSGFLTFPPPDTGTATVSVNGHQLDSSFTLTGSPGSASFNFDVTDPLVFANASFYTGSGTFPVGLQISGFNCVEPATPENCSVNWKGNLTVTFDTTPLPATLPLMGTGLAGLGLAAWRGRRKQKPAT